MNQQHERLARAFRTSVPACAWCWVHRKQNPDFKPRFFGRRALLFSFLISLGVLFVVGQPF